MSSSSEDDDPNVNIIPMDNFVSDGDMNTWPSGGHYFKRPDIRWRELLAENWLKEMGTYEEGELITGFIFSLLSMLDLLHCAALRVAFFVVTASVTVPNCPLLVYFFCFLLACSILPSLFISFICS